jgi:hypothetical protein
MIRKLRLRAGRGAGLNGRGHLGKRDSMTGPFFCIGKALLRGFEFPLGGAPARADLAAASKRARGVGGEMSGHLAQVVVVGAAEAHRPRQGGSGRLGQVPQEAQARLFGGVLVVKRLDRIPASFYFGT